MRGGWRRWCVVSTETSRDPDPARGARVLRAKSSTKTEQGRAVLEVVRELLAEDRDDEIVSLVKQLLARNTELEQRLAQQLSQTRKNEGVSRDQLLLALNGLEPSADEERANADDALRSASEIDQPKSEDRTTRPPRQPSLRKPPPAHLPRVDNPIAVPDEQRPCPSCGAERECIGHDVTEVIDLIPARVIVRVDRREKAHR